MLLAHVTRSEVTDDVVNSVSKEISDKESKNYIPHETLTFASSSKSFNHVSTACLNFPVKSKPRGSRPGVRLSQFLEYKKKD